MHKPGFGTHSVSGIVSTRGVALGVKGYNTDEYHQSQSSD
jgi:hypothetical protein